MDESDYITYKEICYNCFYFLEPKPKWEIERVCLKGRLVRGLKSACSDFKKKQILLHNPNKRKSK